jgi:hypothetical protein
MKKTLITVVLVFGLSIYTFGQKPTKPAATQAVAPVNATASSGSSTLVQGYHYRLGRRYHIKYSSILYMSPPIPAQDQFNPNQVPPKIYNIFDYKFTVVKTPFSGTIPGRPPYNEAYPGGTSKIVATKGNWNDGSVVNNAQAIKVIRDTVSRYLDQKLWVSVTQGDSGKLVIQFYNVPSQKYYDTDPKDHNLALLNENDNKAEKDKETPSTVIKESFTRKITDDNIDVAAYSDKTFDIAIPIAPLDSAQNFYLKVKNKVHFSDPLYFISLPYYVWQYGAATIPFKLRFGNSKTIINTPDINKAYTLSVPTEATTSFNLATYFGYKMGKTRFYNDQTKSHNTVSFMIAGFAGISSTALTNSNLKYVPNPDPTLATTVGTSTVYASKTDLNKYPTSLLSVSPGLSVTLEYGPLNFGIFSGADVPFQKTAWVYADKIWIGFGIGFNLGMFTSAGNVGL